MGGWGELRLNSPQTCAVSGMMATSGFEVNGLSTTGIPRRDWTRFGTQSGTQAVLRKGCQGGMLVDGVDSGTGIVFCGWWKHLDDMNLMEANVWSMICVDKAVVAAVLMLRLQCQLGRGWPEGPCQDMVNRDTCIWSCQGCSLYRIVS